MDTDKSLLEKNFIIWGNGGTIERQGEIVGRPEPRFYLVRFFSFSTGEETTLAIYSIESMKAARDEGCFEFFYSDIALRKFCENYKVPTQRSSKMRRNG